MDKFFKIAILMVLFVGCKNNSINKTINDMSQNLIIKDSISALLYRQLKAGEGTSGEFGDYLNYSITQNDFEITEMVIAQIIQKKGYKKPLYKYFRDKIKMLFDVDAEKVSHLYLDCQFICEDVPISIYEVEEGLGEQMLHIDTLYCMITRTHFLPEIIDYHNLYPDIAKIEDNIDTKIMLDGGNALLKRWKDIPELSAQRKSNIERLVHRNKYLFNDSKSSLTWLIINDLEFLENLVRIFGYDKETQINKAVLSKIHSDYTKNQLEHFFYDENRLIDLFAKKDCNGKLQIREGLLKYIADNTPFNNNELYTMMGEYGEILIRDYDNSEAFRKSFTLKEQLKIVAYVGYYMELTRIKNNIKGFEENWERNTLLHNELGGNKELLEEIRRNNYYDLPDFENIIQDVLIQITEETEEYNRTHDFEN
jgi:hypothetical protein